MRAVRFEPSAFADLQHWTKENRKLLERIFRMIEEAAKTPFEGIGKPEPLRANLKGYWSRRIDDEHRLVYRVEDAQLVVISMRGHYS